VTSSQVDGTPAVAFTYDLDGVMTNAGGMSITSNVLGQPTATALATVSESLTYNAFGELATQTATANGAPLISEQYTRDRDGRITMRVETIDGTTSVFTYTYDARGRLVAVTKDGAAFASYGYDANGNRITWSRAGETRSASYDDGDRLLALGDATFAYSQNGERLSSSDAIYAFDALGNLVEATRSGTTIAYILVGHDRRIGKRIGGTLVQGFLYDDLLRPIAELSGSGAVVSRFVYANGRVPTSMIRGGATYRILSDERGSPRLVVAAATGAIVQRMDYDELGNVLADTNPGFQPFGFASGLYDRDTRLTHFGAREYDAATGTWLSADPLGFASGDTNMYAYCGADPINHIDPTGLAEEHYNIPTGETRGPYFHILDPENTEGEYVTAAVRRHEVQHFFQNALMVFLTPLFVPPWVLDRGAFRKEAQFIQYLLDHACEYGLDKPERARERAALEKMLEEARAASTEEGAKKYIADNSIDPNIGLVQAWNKFIAWMNE
jgi:RHS repeat-associated protein